jgi:hypothetical protein
MMGPDIGHGQRNVFSESAGTIHANALGMCAEVAPAGKAITATAANDMALSADNHSRVKVIDVRPNRHDLANELVPNDKRYWNGALSPLIPLVDVQIGATDSCQQDAY